MDSTLSTDEFVESIFTSWDDVQGMADIIGIPDVVTTPLLVSMRDDLCKGMQKIITRYRLGELELVENVLDPSLYPKQIESIKSFVGDDETVTTNCLLYAIGCIAAGPIITKIKVSWSDVQFNKDMYNYAEGWVIIPPSMDSGFESVSRYNRHAGVPFVLDQVKLKNLSAVRKQSKMEVEFTSKFQSVAESAAWTDPSWFTWDLHQFALIIAIEIFDFARSKAFPYLFAGESGCGGAPPFGNLLTAAAAIFRYQGGRAKKGILGVMSDANDVHFGRLKAEDAIFAKNLNLALSGDTKWLRVRSELEARRKGLDEPDLPYDDRIVAAAENIIPAELEYGGETVNPADALSGTAISFLRSKGYIMTELDLVMKAEQENRLQAIWGRVPLKEIEDQAEVRRKDYKEAFLEVLSDITLMPHVDHKAYRTIEAIESPMEASSLAIMMSYYKMRVEQAAAFSTFVFNERIRIYKTEDVERYYHRGCAMIRSGFADDLGMSFRPDWRRRFLLPDEERDYDRIEKWLRSGPLHQLMQGDFPPGIGVDDARIAKEIRDKMQDDVMHGYQGMMYLIVSSDKKMITTCQQICDHACLGKPGEVRVVGLDVPGYISWCLLPEKKRQGNPGFGTGWIQGVEVINAVRPELGNTVHGPLSDALALEARFLSNYRKKSFRVFYDYPNINRTFKRFTVDKSQDLAIEYTGGFLSRAKIEHTPRMPAMSLEKIFSLEEFDFHRRKAIYPASRGRLRLFVPRRRGITIRSWR